MDSFQEAGESRGRCSLPCRGSSRRGGCRRPRTAARTGAPNPTISPQARRRPLPMHATARQGASRDPGTSCTCMPANTGEDSAQGRAKCDGGVESATDGGTEQRHAMVATHGSAAAARSAGHPARAASPANTASTRSSGRQSNASTTMPRWPDTTTFCFGGSVVALLLPPPQLPLLRPLLVVGFLMAAGQHRQGRGRDTLCGAGRERGDR